MLLHRQISGEQEWEAHYRILVSSWRCLISTCKEFRAQRVAQPTLEFLGERHNDRKRAMIEFNTLDLARLIAREHGEPLNRFLAQGVAFPFEKSRLAHGCLLGKGDAFVNSGSGKEESADSRCSVYRRIGNGRNEPRVLHKSRGEHLE